jgi:hypothetical protein
MLTVAATTMINIQKAKLVVMNVCRSSKYKIKYILFLSVTEQNSKASTNFSEKKTPIANSSKIHLVETDILHPERGKQTDGQNEANRRY